MTNRIYCDKKSISTQHIDNKKRGKFSKIEDKRLFKETQRIKVSPFFDALSRRKMKKIVGLTYDLKTDYKFKDNDPPDANAEFDHPLTIDLIARSIESLGHKVIKIGNVRNLLKKIDSLKVDIVFNISEGLYGRNRESQVPILLEMKGVPFVGSDGLTLGATLDKVIAKKIFLPCSSYWVSRQRSEKSSLRRRPCHSL